MPLNGVKRLRQTTVIAAGLISFLLALLLWPWSTAAAEGLLLGAGAGIVPFWIFGLHVERTARAAPGRLEAVSPKWTLLRVGLSVFALLQGYYFEPDTGHGLLAALAGLFILRGVLMVLALTGLDLKLGRD